jgi:Sulfotransferase family
MADSTQGPDDDLTGFEMSPAAAAKRRSAEAPFFVVGCPRSGTTLVRWMLREHPRLAIPPEAQWIVEAAPPIDGWSRDLENRVLDEILRHPTYARWPFGETATRAIVARRGPSRYAELVEGLFAAYAEREEKPRWGDKTPENVNHIEFLSRLYPDAVFVHVIRDGREVAASLAERGWTTSWLAGKAYWWRDCVTAGRRAGEQLGPRRYCEVRLEDIVADPEGELRRICAAIGESYTPRMLEYPRRIGEMDSWPTDRRRSHRHLAKPPTAGLRDWKAGVSAGEQDEVIRICQPLLRELGYEG